VKNRQGRAEEAGLELIEGLIQKNNMMDHKVLLFLLEPGAIKPEIRGLIANKIMAKYQRPCCILTETTHEYNGGEIEYSKNSLFPILHLKGEKYTAYEGSARGCDKVGVTEFKDICAATEACEYTVGHQGAFGLGIRKTNVQKFIESTDKQLANMSSEPVYYVDYIWQAPSANAEKILEIAELDGLWGKDMDEALVAVEEIKVTKNNITMMASNTVKITLPNGISMIKFRMPDEEYKRLYSEHGKVTINAVCKCQVNNWNGNKYPQLLLEDWEIISKCAYEF
jgi:single-stranded-DNA-specific exonuclease